MEKRIIPFILLFVILFSSITVFGERIFTDVADDHWAYEYIKKVVDLGLMDGYDDATFRPNELVNTVDALTYITRLLSVEKDELDRLMEEYQVALSNGQLKEDFENSIVIALDKGFIDEEFIKEELFHEGKVRKATKLEISKYLAKAMGVELEEYDKSLIFFYKDAKDIPESDKPYVKFLIDKGVLGEKGDENGNFNPNQEVTRAILAKMLYQAYDAMSTRPIIEVERITEPEDIGTIEEIDEPDEIDKTEEVELVEEIGHEEISGTILMFMRDFLIIDTGDRIDSYIINENTQVIIDGESTDVESLEEEMEVKLLISEDESIEKIEVENISNIVHGIIVEIYLGEDPYLIIEMNNGYTKKLGLLENPEVVLDGRNSYLFSLDEGDRVKVETFEDMALSITGESKEGRVIGILNCKVLDEEKSILVERENGSIYEYKVNSEAIINRDSNGVEVEGLRVSDELILLIRDGEVYRIDAYSVPGEDRGYIREILISHEPILTIEREDGTIVSYYILDRATMVKDNNILSIYDLRLGDIVDLELKSDEIVNLKVQVKTEE